jgi:YfiH family protein
MILNSYYRYWNQRVPNLQANWPAPSHIKALTTTRTPGFSLLPYDQNNLALHVGDDQARVIANRQQLVNTLALPAEPEWLVQTHSTDCVIVEEERNREADAAITRIPNTPLAIMTADCLPIVLCNPAGTEIAAIHAGWRGLANGVIENTLEKMKSGPNTLMAWIGPAICQDCYQIGEEVRETFSARYPYTKATFSLKGSHWHANLSKMAELILHAQGVQAVYPSGACTFERNNEFYSYRREAQTGRIATLIWFTTQDNEHV